MQHAKNVLENNKDKTIIIDEEELKYLETCQFEKEAIFTLYTYMYNNPEHHVYIGYLVTQDDIIGSYVGWTGPKTKNFLEKNQGKTLLINKTLFSSASDSFGNEALHTIDVYIHENDNNKIFYI